MKQATFTKVIVVVLAVMSASNASAQQSRWRDTTLSIEKRVDDLISNLSLEEKISLLQHHNPSIEHVGLKPYSWWSEALHGVARNGKATVYPMPIAMAATWDYALVEEAFRSIAVEARRKYADERLQGNYGDNKGVTFFTPNINLLRDPRWGRGMETFGEDPWLTARMGLAAVNGLQTRIGRRNILAAACLKHLAVHSGPEAQRHQFNARVSSHDLFTSYLPAFEYIVKNSNVQQVMCAYNRLDGEPCCTNNRLLSDILRKQWRFDGIVVTDCWALNDCWERDPKTPRHETFPDAKAAAAAAFAGEVDMECGSGLQALKEAVDAGLIDRATIDRHVRRVKRPGDDASSSGSWGFWLALGTFFLLLVLVGVWQIAESFPKVRRFWGGRLKQAVLALGMVLFGVPFATGGGVMLFTEALTSFKLAREDLVSVPGKVLYTGTASHSGGRSITYSPVVAYEYDFQGKKYENDSFNGPQGDFSTSDRRSVRQVARSYQPGSTVEVWVLPSNPRHSAIRPVGATVKYGALGASLLFLLVGLGVSGTGVFLLIHALREKRNDQLGEWTLRRSCTNTIFLGVFAGFWNLLAWSMALVFMGEPGPRDPMMLLVWTFPLIGLGVAAAFAVSLRRDLRAPKLAMTLTLPDGATPTLDWRLDDPFSVRSLSIQLEGLASAGRGESVDVSLPVCKHAAPLSGTGRETFHFLPADAPKWRLAATLETRTASRPFRLEYPIPETFLP
jgi:beta-glucosidase-like glycosyl hydrolase